MKNHAMIFLRSGATIALMTGALLGLPSLSQAASIACSVATQETEKVLQCFNDDGTPARLRPPLRDTVNLEFGLFLLGCNVSKIDGDLNDADEAIACVQAMFGLTPGPLSRVDANRISSLGRVVHSREDALRYMATRGYHPIEVQVAQTEAPPPAELQASAAAEHDSEFPYLPQDKARYFTRILQGDARAGNSASNKIGIYLAFHRAFSASCPVEIGDDSAEYTLTRESERLGLREAEQIRLRSTDLDEFYLAASMLVPVVILEYDEDPTKDFDIRRIYQIRVATDAENQAAFAQVLAREGCQSDLTETLSAALSENLPQMSASAGESTVSMYFQTITGARSLNVTLNSPYDPDSIRATKIVSSSDTGLFPLGGDYGGRMLSYLALGDFPAARGEHRKPADEVIRQIRALGPAGYNPVAELYEWGFQNSANFSPMSALITSYIIRRVQTLGSCGDPLVTVTRNYVEIETTRVGGVETGSRQVGSFSREAIVPAAFKQIVERAEDITPGVNSRELVDGAIERLTCDSEMRRNLEANMIAFNSGVEPVWVNPESRRTFGSDENNAEASQSAYIYTNFDAAVELIENAAQKNDSRLSLRYGLPNNSDRSAAQLNLLLIEDVPAMVFDTSYFGRKPGGRDPGRMVRLIMTCADSGELEVSQFLSSTQPNDLDPDSIYNITYGAYGLNGQWPMTAHLESEIANSNSFTFARFRGRIAADDTTFVGLRPTSNFTSSLAMPNGNYHLSFGVDGGRVNTTLAPLIDHCRSIETL